MQINASGFSSGTGELTYTWTQVSGPAVSIDGADTGQPSFETPELDSSTTMRFRVEVSDGTTTGIEYVTVGITADNDPVVIDLGPDLTVTEETLSPSARRSWTPRATTRPTPGSRSPVRRSISRTPTR